MASLSLKPVVSGALAESQRKRQCGSRVAGERMHQDFIWWAVMVPTQRVTASDTPQGLIVG